MRNVFAQRRSEFWIALITALMVAFIGVEHGIMLALVLSLIDHTRRGYRPRNTLLVPNVAGTWHPHPVATRAQALPGLVIYRFTHSMYYANSQQLADEISFLMKTETPPLRWLCIEASAVDDVDYTAAEVLRSLGAASKEKGVRLVFAQVLSDLAAEGHYALVNFYGADTFYSSLNELMKAYELHAQLPTHEPSPL
jgi:MFS superfamily sulfate permease-like transporter